MVNLGHFVTLLNGCIFYPNHETPHITKKPVDHICDKHMFGVHVILRNFCKKFNISQKSAAHGMGSTLLEAKK